MAPIAVVVLGGGAVLRPSQRGAVEDTRANLAETCRALARLAADGYRLVITHGSGVQVGNILLQNVQARSLVPAMPLDVCGAQGQGQVGYLIQNAMEQALAEAGLGQPVACVLTRVLVDSADPAFQDPSRPVGPLYTPSKAMDLMRRGLTLREGPAGWRQVVPSPDPAAVLEAPLIRRLLDDGAAVVAGGGGGVPVVRDSAGELHGVEAVLEKELTGFRLGLELGAELLVLLTRKPQALTRPPQAAPDQTRLTPAEARRAVAEGRCPDGPMALKLTAAARFVSGGRGRALISSVDGLPEALRGEAGTWVTM